VFRLEGVGDKQNPSNIEFSVNAFKHTRLSPFKTFSSQRRFLGYCDFSVYYLYQILLQNIIL